MSIMIVLENKLSYFKKNILPLCTAKETSATPEEWTKEHHTQGHGLLISCFFCTQLPGAKLMRGLCIMPNKEKKPYYYAVWNEQRIEMTLEACGATHDSSSVSENISVEKMLANGVVGERYALFEKKAEATMQALGFIFKAPS